MPLKRFVALIFALVVVAMPAVTISPAPAHAQGNTIQSIDIDVRIQPDGSAKVSDHRRFTATEGTEHYLPFENLGESDITDFYVTENGRRLQEQTPWDTSASLEEKAGKYGINQISGGLELCFGIGQLGSREFTIYYTITNFVRMLEDGNQAIYWQFLHEDMDPVDHVRISVRSPEGFEFEYPATKLWGFGFDGSTEIQPQALSMSSTEFTQSSRAVMLAILPPDTVNANANYPYDSAGIEAEAKQGSDWDTELPNPSGPPMRFVLTFLVFGVLWLSIPLLLFFAFFKFVRKRATTSSGFLPSTRLIEHTTVMPPHDPYALAALYRHSHQDLVRASLIKWILEGAMVQEDYERNFLLWRSNELGLRIAGAPRYISDAERRLFDHFRTAAGSDGLLEQSEITRHFTNNQREFSDWCDEVRIASQRFLERQGLIQRVEKGAIFRRTVFEPTEQGQALVDHLSGFGAYLRDGWYPEAAPEPEKHMMWAAFLDALDRAKDRLGPTFIYAAPAESASKISTAAHRGYTPSASSSGGGGSSSRGGGRSASGGSRGGGTR